jgi:hypothetical protein
MLSTDPAALSKTGLRLIHFVGLVLGLGAATLLDLIIIRFVLMRQIADEHINVIEFSSKVVAVGLGLLWLSGVGFLVHYGLFDPAKLWNPKVWAKITIVAVLSINGVLVHHFVLPAIRNQVGRGLFDGRSRANRSFLLFSGTVSAISWYVPLLLGAVPQLNFAVPAWVILTGYAVLIVASGTVAQMAIALVSREVSLRSISIPGRVALGRGAIAVGLALVGVVFVTTGPLLWKANDESALRIVESSKSAPDQQAVAEVTSATPIRRPAGSMSDGATTAVWQTASGVD